MDFSKIKPDFRSEIIRGGELHLDGQLKVATSADLRASNLAGMFVAITTGLLAAVVALANSANISSKVPLLFGAGAAALLFLVAAVVCLRAVMPVGFWLPGNEPANWDTDVAAGKELHDCLDALADHIQDYIGENLTVLETNAWRFKLGAWVGAAAPFVGVIVWILVSIGSWIK
jgi:hypothetical protein